MCCLLWCMTSCFCILKHQKYRYNVFHGIQNSKWPLIIMYSVEYKISNRYKVFWSIKNIAIMYSTEYKIANRYIVFWGIKNIAIMYSVEYKIAPWYFVFLGIHMTHEKYSTVQFYIYLRILYLFETLLQQQWALFWVWYLVCLEWARICPNLFQFVKLK